MNVRVLAVLGLITVATAQDCEEIDKRGRCNKEDCCEWSRTNEACEVVANSGCSPPITTNTASPTAVPTLAPVLPDTATPTLGPSRTPTSRTPTNFPTGDPTPAPSPLPTAFTFKNEKWGLYVKRDDSTNYSWEVGQAYCATHNG